MPGPLLLGIPLWAWITGGAVAGGVVALDKSTDLMDETGQTIDATTRLTKAVTVAGVVYVSYRALQASGALK